MIDEAQEALALLSGEVRPRWYAVVIRTHSRSAEKYVFVFLAYDGNDALLQIKIKWPKEDYTITICCLRPATKTEIDEAIGRYSHDAGGATVRFCNVSHIYTDVSRTLESF